MASDKPTDDDLFVNDQGKKWQEWARNYKYYLGAHWLISIIGIVCATSITMGIDSLRPYTQILSGVAALCTALLALVKFQTTASRFETASRRLRIGVQQYHAHIDNDDVKARESLLKARQEAESLLNVANA